MTDPQLVHLGTIVQTTFGLIDGKNVIPQEPVQVQVSDLTSSALQKAYQEIRKAEVNALSEFTKSQSKPKRRSHKSK